MKRALVLTVVPVVVTLLASACDDDASPAPAASEAGAEAAANPADAAGAADAIADSAPSCETLPGSYGSKGCNDCMKTSCCSQIAACEGEAACKALQACALACISNPDAGACLKDCESNNASGKPSWKKVYDCWFSDPPGCGVSCT